VCRPLIGRSAPGKVCCCSSMRRTHSWVAAGERAYTCAPRLCAGRHKHTLLRVCAHDACAWACLHYDWYARRCSCTFFAWRAQRLRRHALAGDHMHDLDCLVGQTCAGFIPLMILSIFNRPSSGKCDQNECVGARTCLASAASPPVSPLLASCAQTRNVWVHLASVWVHLARAGTCASLAGACPHHLLAHVLLSFLQRRDE